MSKTIISRQEILDWINSLLGIRYTKIEETSNGAAFCQILDVIFPGDVKLRNVNYNARTEPEMLSNYKIVQAVFDKHSIERNLPVELLIKGKPMAALEMMQWLKVFFEETYNGGEYDGATRRAEVGCREPGEVGKKKRAAATTANPRSARAAPAVTPAAPKSQVQQNTKQPQQQQNAAVLKTAVVNRYPTQTPSSRVNNQQVQTLKAKIDELKNDNQILLEERNFYYEKLQQIESLCQSQGKDEFAEKVLSILYQTDEEHGFVSPDEIDI